ncbi:ANK_REP_REGION domain-containing protein [Trichoderma simmonsii]|uniref:ANK_REP_REGION domain-containing protein n=1 Tax=Trichoderma simmonsii TaxID=1491479 RepID=A0A8G0LPN6_9HYPO|nr:ANK_REP_REGION domain-containing protein [Trichoderma simmonsii]
MPKRPNEADDEHASPDAKKIRLGSLSDLVKFNHADYTIGWICALSKEQTAAIAMLDRKHPDLPSLANDDNAYTFGSIGGHNIVIACLPKGRYGTNSAATIAAKMLSSFPSIKFGLLVGIGGGIPSKVRLGDVVVSTPIDQYPGVVQWDLGKAEVGGKFRRTGALNSPPNALLTVLSKLESEHEMEESKIPVFLDEMRQKYPKLYPKYFWNQSLRDPQDQSGEATEMRCPDIHHGLIASGNQVIKDAAVRDRLDEDLDGNVLCIEMEAAGLMNDFPCLVVRGICDYADSNKNKDWQEYAAAVAAAYAKEVLSVLQISAVEHMESVQDILSNINAELGSLQTAFSEMTTRQYAQDHQAFLNWLTPVDYTLQQKDYFSKRQPGTGQWLLKSDIFQDWVGNSQQTLFCPGIPGAGKTILTSMVVNDLFERFNKDPRVGIAYLYCNFRRHDEQKLHDLLLSLLKQLAYGQSCLPQDAKTIFDAYKDKTQRPSLDDIKKLLRCMADSYLRVFILVDALDECQGSDGCRESLLTHMFLLRDESKVNIFATSRLIPEIMEKFKACKRMEIRASEDDVRTYIQGQLEGGTMEHLPSLVKRKPKLKNELIKGISDAVDGMFLLAKIYLDTLVDKVTIADVREAVMQLPKQISGSGEDKRLEILNQAYESAWERINGQKEGFRNIATRVLAWISFAKRPLYTAELQHALAVKIGMDVFDEDAMPQVHDMVSFCAGLVTIDEESDVIRLVHYTTQEFFDRKKSDWFPNAEAMIAETCISYLSLEVFGEYCLGGFDLDDSDLVKTHLDYLCSCGLYKYASYYWGDHARVAGRKLDESVIGFLMRGARASTAFHVMLKRFPISDRIKNPDYSDESWDFSLKPFSLVSGLHLAVHFELYEAINMLLKNGCDINGCKGLEVTPLLMAIDNGHTGIAEMLLDNGAHMGAVSGLSLLYLTVAMEPENYSEKLVQRFITKGINDGEDISLYLLPAVEFGHEAIVKFLLDKGADVNATYDHFDTPLQTAALSDQEAMIKLLLHNGANIEVADFRGKTPLHSAIEFFNEAAVKLLLDEGANIEAADNNGLRPLHTAADGRQKIVKLLLDKGADVDAADNDGRRPLHVAYDNAELWPEWRPRELIRSEKYAIVEMLIENGANIEATDHHGRRPLDIAKERQLLILKIGRYKAWQEYLRGKIY